MKAFLFLGTLSLIAAILGGCASGIQNTVPQDAQKSVPPGTANLAKAPVHLCKVITKEDIHTILGDRYDVTELQNGHACRFYVPGNAQSTQQTAEESFYITVRLYDTPDSAKNIYQEHENDDNTQQLQGRSAPKDIENLGEKAYLVHDNESPLNTYILDGNKYLTVTVFNPTDQDDAIITKITALISKLSPK